MNLRWWRVGICIVLGLTWLGCGWLVPAHLRAVDAGVVFSAGRTGDSLLERGQALLVADRLGAAQWLASAAQQAAMPGWDRLHDAVAARARENPGAVFWGNDTRTAALFHPAPDAQAFSGFIVLQENREPALEHLGQSTATGVPELMRCRTLNRTVLFPPSSSAAGQAFDAVLAATGLLLDGNHLTSSLGGQIKELAQAADRGAGSQPLEQVLMDVGSLGERLNWDQLTAFLGLVPDVATLHQLAGQAGNAGGRLPLLFAAVQLCGHPRAVAGYLTEFSQTGLPDISSALWYGADGVRMLAESGRRFYASAGLRWVATHTPLGGLYYYAAARSFENPRLALAVRWGFFLAAGFCFALALHFSRRPLSGVEAALQVRGVHLAREFLFSLGFLLVVLLLSEPFLAQESQKGDFSLRLHLPMAGGAIPAGIAEVKHSVMNLNPTILLTLLVFFVLQALIYVSCLVKLAEIRRQAVPPRIKLKLLENEDHLFDAGLYLGFVGTIVSLIIASMGLVKFSLMAAYSSTSFGIIFVVIFKIFSLRPARRTLLLEAELGTDLPANLPATEAASEPVLTP